MNEMTMEIEKKEDTTPATVERSQNLRTFVPRVDIIETGENVIVSADMPGVIEQNIDITLEKNVLTIRGSFAGINAEGYKPVHSEYCAGTYERAFSLSDKVNRDNIEATFKNGVLQVVLTKVEEGYMIKDLGSTNGTFVDKKEIGEKYLLKPGDTVMLGDAIYMTYMADPDPEVTLVSSRSKESDSAAYGRQRPPMIPSSPCSWAPNRAAESHWAQPSPSPFHAVQQFWLIQHGISHNLAEAGSLPAFRCFEIV